MADVFDDSVTKKPDVVIPADPRTMARGPAVGIGLEQEPPAPPDPHLQPSAQPRLDYSDGELHVPEHQVRRP